MSERALTPAQQAIVNAMAAGAVVVHFSGFGNYIKKYYEIVRPNERPERLSLVAMTSLLNRHFFTLTPRKREPLYYDVTLSPAGLAALDAYHTSTPAMETEHRNMSLKEAAQIATAIAAEMEERIAQAARNEAGTDEPDYDDSDTNLYLSLSETLAKQLRDERRRRERGVRRAEAAEHERGELFLHGYADKDASAPAAEHRAFDAQYTDYLTRRTEIPGLPPPQSYVQWLEDYAAHLEAERDWNSEEHKAAVAALTTRAETAEQESEGYAVMLGGVMAGLHGIFDERIDPFEGTTSEMLASVRQYVTYLEGDKKRITRDVLQRLLDKHTGAAEDHQRAIASISSIIAELAKPD